MPKTLIIFNQCLGPAIGGLVAYYRTSSTSILKSLMSSKLRYTLA